MLLSDIETMVRQDLFDPLGGPNMRWQTSDIDRAIDKAVDRYSSYYPNVVWSDMSAEPFQRTYPYPQPWNASYPVWWIERELSPLQSFGSYFPVPAAGPTLGLGNGVQLGVGIYKYAATLLSQGGETPPSPITQITTTNSHQQVALTAIPLGSAAPSTPGSATNTVIGRNLYRTLVGGSQLYLLATIPDNTTTTYTDLVPDASLNQNALPPSVNTSGVMLWP